MPQIIKIGPGIVSYADTLLAELHIKKYLLVHDMSFHHLSIKDCFEKSMIASAVFSSFTSNPLYDDVCKGVAKFRNEGCAAIVAVGGGSTIDVAKCIKLFSTMEGSGEHGSFLKQTYQENNIPLIAVPTTAGTGSESTRFAVIYYHENKQSITHESLIPGYALLDSDALTTLPLYQKKCSMLDALCQGIESWWSVHSTPESIIYSRSAVGNIIAYMEAYLGGDHPIASEIMLQAANDAGRAINITQTTAPHAMSYKLTSMYHLPHGHAVAVCLPRVWRYMITHLWQCTDSRGRRYLEKIFMDISEALGCKTPQEAVTYFEQLLEALDIRYPERITPEELDVLAISVNIDRLANNPVRLTESALRDLYQNTKKADCV